MNRTVMQFTVTELQEVFARVGENQSIHPLLKSKLETAIQSGQDVGLEITEEDLELILDEFILPTPNDTDSSFSIRKKIQQRLLDFRSQSK